MSQPTIHQIDAYQIVARAGLPLRGSPHGNPFDILLKSRVDGELKRVAEISFYTGEAPPDNLINNPTLGRYPIVQAPLETFQGFVDVLRNETTPNVQIDDLSGRPGARGTFHWSVWVQTADEPTGECDKSPPMPRVA